MKYIIIIIAAVSTYLTGCSGTENKSKFGKFSGYDISDSARIGIKDYILIDSSQSIKIEDIEKNISFSIVENVNYIPLETTRDSRIAQICKIKVHNDTIFILDNTTSKNLYIFTYGGKFINKIRNFGEGPLEIMDPYDFDIDTKHNQLVILDGKMSKMVYYSLTGNPIKQKRIFFRLQNFRFINESEILAYIGINDNSHLDKLGDYDLMTIDTSFNIKFHGFNRYLSDDKTRYTLLDHLHNSSNNNIIYSPKFVNSIFKIDSSNTIKKVFDFNFPNEIPSKYYKKEISEIFKYSKENDKYFSDGTYEENNNVVYTKIFTPLIKNQIHIFFDKTTKKYIYGRVHLENQDKDMTLWSLPISSYKNSFISAISSEILSQLKSYPNLNMTSDTKFKKIVENSNESDNPILQIYSININK